MPKAVDFAPIFEKRFANLMMYGSAEVGARRGANLTHMEALAITTMRILVGMGAIDFERFVDMAVDIAAEEDLKPTQQLVLRENLNTMFNDLGEFTGLISFHNVQ